MRECWLEDGETLYRVGDPPAEIFIVKSGTVILRSLDGSGRLRDHVKPAGALFGADEMLGGLNRMADAIAQGMTEIAAFSPNELSAVLGARQGAETQQAQQATPVEAALPPDPDPSIIDLDPSAAAAARLYPDAEPLIDKLGDEPIIIESFPFVVGRKDRSQKQGLQLAIEDEKPFHLSRRHFMVDFRRGEFSVSDCGSHHGTLVDGELLGAGEPVFRAALGPGKHEIIAGRAVSPFRFTCIVPG